MSKTICGIDCSTCYLFGTCKGCEQTLGKPFGSDCLVAKCAIKNKFSTCSECNNKICKLKEEVIEEINSLHIENMETITKLYQLKGSVVNLDYTLPNGKSIKFWDDNKIYLGCQVEKKDSKRFYGVIADENYMLICEYGINGTDPEIIIYKKRK